MYPKWKIKLRINKIPYAGWGDGGACGISRAGSPRSHHSGAASDRYTGGWSESYSGINIQSMLEYKYTIIYLIL